MATEFRYTYLGDALTDPDLLGLQCDPIRRVDGKCVVSVKMATAMVHDLSGKRHVVKRRRLRLNSKSKDKWRFAMPVDLNRYPDNWKVISQQVRFERAEGKCEWCGVSHLARGARDRFGVWHNEDDIHAMQSDEGERIFPDGFPHTIRIILTTAHIGIPKYPGDVGDKSDKMDCRLNNLKALCQRCHLNFDRDEHIKNRKRTLAKKAEARFQAELQARRANGQDTLPLFDEILGDTK